MISKFNLALNVVFFLLITVGLYAQQGINYKAVIKDAGDNLSPALIANYTYDLVKSYNSFYQSVSIFREEDQEKVNLRLQLSKEVSQVIKSSMALLGIKVPNRM